MKSLIYVCLLALLVISTNASEDNDYGEIESSLEEIYHEEDEDTVEHAVEHSEMDFTTSSFLDSQETEKADSFATETTTTESSDLVTNNQDSEQMTTIDAVDIDSEGSSHVNDVKEDEHIIEETVSNDNEPLFTIPSNRPSDTDDFENALLPEDGEKNEESSTDSYVTTTSSMINTTTIIEETDESSEPSPAHDETVDVQYTPSSENSEIGENVENNNEYESKENFETTDGDEHYSDKDEQEIEDDDFFTTQESTTTEETITTTTPTTPTTPTTTTSTTTTSTTTSTTTTTTKKPLSTTTPFAFKTKPILTTPAVCGTASCEYGLKENITDTSCPCYNPCEKIRCPSRNVCIIRENEYGPQARCESATQIRRPVRCTERLSYGNCKMYTSRFYFNTASQRCVHFIYTGCDGTANNFASREHCLATCNTCAQPVNKGSCSGSVLRYFYDAEKGECVGFNYGGCGGNDNNYVTKIKCEQNCITQDHFRPISLRRKRSF